MSVTHLNQVELAARWKISPRTLERWRWTGEGPAFIKIGGRVVYRLEDVEAYEVEILAGTTVKRRLSTTTTSVLYSAAQQIADRGALLGPGDSLDIRICQLSALIGRGAARSLTLSF